MLAGFDVTSVRHLGLHSFMAILTTNGKLSHLQVKGRLAEVDSTLAPYGEN